jgi:hypothetical protein
LAWISKEHNTQDQFDTWGVDASLLNHVKNWVWNFYPYTLYFKHFNYIAG